MKMIISRHQILMLKIIQALFKTDKMMKKILIPYLYRRKKRKILKVKTCNQISKMKMKIIMDKWIKLSSNFRHKLQLKNQQLHKKTNPKLLLLNKVKFTLVSKSLKKHKVSNQLFSKLQNKK